MITSASLKEYTLKDLAQMAKKRSISGWHSMRKGELIQALVRDAKSSAKGSKRSKAVTSRKNGLSRASVTSAKNGSESVRGNGAKRRNGVAAKGSSSRTGKSGGNGNGSTKPTRPKNPRVTQRIQRAQRETVQKKDISGQVEPTDGRKGKTADCATDRVVLMVRGPYWLHAHWELTSRSIQRAQAAMAEHWHTARPILRLIEVASGSTTSTTESHVRDIEIHGGVNDWYIDVATPPKGYRIEVGYLATGGRFHALARSNSVQTPLPGNGDPVDDNWSDVAENCERIFALSGGYSSETNAGELQELLEERLQRPMGSPMVTRYGVGAQLCLEHEIEFGVSVDAEMIVHGSTQPDAHVTLAGEPIKVRPDGTFMVRMSMPDRRQVLPIVASSADGMKQQTVVLAIERNTKVMEPILRDSN